MILTHLYNTTFEDFALRGTVQSKDELIGLHNGIEARWKFSVVQVSLGDGGEVPQGIGPLQSSDFTVDQTHVGKFIPCSGTLTAMFPADSTTPLSPGIQVQLGQAGSRSIVVAGEAGVTLIGNLMSTSVGDVLTVKKIASDTWWVL